MKAICSCGFTFFSESTQCVCPKCGADITMILGLNGYGGNMAPAIVSMFFVMPSPCGDRNKIWMRSASGESGDFSREAFEEALRNGLASGTVDESLNRFFWENF